MMDRRAVGKDKFHVEDHETTHGVIRKTGAARGSISGHLPRAVKTDRDQICVRRRCVAQPVLVNLLK